MTQPTPNTPAIDPFAVLRTGFWTTRSCGPDKLFELSIRFPTLKALHAADDELRAAVRASMAERPAADTKPVVAAYETLMQAIKGDESLAWAWHCNVAINAVDAGTPHKQANEGAARFMQLAFNVDVRQFEAWKSLERQWAENEADETFQQRVQPWMLECFGAEISANCLERNHRFFEEATELVQANGMTRSEAHQLVDYTFNRPVGDLRQEVGGVMVTLAALCLAAGADMHADGEIELRRINDPEVIEKIRAKQAAKPKHSPLPEVTP